MILFFGDTSVQVFALKCNQQLPHSEIQKLSWLFGEQPLLETQTIVGEFYGPRATMVTPWSTNAVEITQNMGLSGIERIEVYKPAFDKNYDVSKKLIIYHELGHDLFNLPHNDNILIMMPTLPQRMVSIGQEHYDAFFNLVKR